ncbi:hypothetical protein AW168_35475 [Nocardia brasiliensis]|uniref:Uncharacterized protein n=2 Tax=Nocardiaceae TaxID=85025 RepID=K0EZ42_NOCB7|nr:hypothetical protein O3I_024035 [Nocardia brasiliensis ATCC 700358]OCF85563.1 hypothetical protein AW168_35475 [Nocardia brasiliensis]
MKIDYRSPERMEFEVGRVEFDDPQYSSGGGYYLSGCYVRRAGRETGSDRYYVVLRMYQIYDEGVASAIADTKPPVLISW